MENHNVSWENSLFLWRFSIAMLVYQRVNQWSPSRPVFMVGASTHGCVSGRNPSRMSLGYVPSLLPLLETPRLASFRLSYRDIHKSCCWLGYLSGKNKSLPLSNHQLLLVIYGPVQEIYHIRKLINEPPSPQIMESEKVVPLSYKLVYNPETIPVPIYKYKSTYIYIYV